MSVEQQYQKIAQNFTPALPAEWRKAWISGEVSSDHTDLEFGYEDDRGGESWIVPETTNRLEIRDALKSLRDIMAAPGQQPWSRCAFRLFPDGNFKFDVEYDD